MNKDQRLIAAPIAPAPIAPAPIAFKTELTPIGEQFMIPGTESNKAPGAKQLSLWG